MKEHPTAHEEDDSADLRRQQTARTVVCAAAGWTPPSSSPTSKAASPSRDCEKADSGLEHADGDDELRTGLRHGGRRESLSVHRRDGSGHHRARPGLRRLGRELVGDDPEALRRSTKVFLGQLGECRGVRPARARRASAALSSRRIARRSAVPRCCCWPASWARDLQRRGVICVVPNPRGGVWVFRGWSDEVRTSPQANGEQQKGGEHA